MSGLEVFLLVSVIVLILVVAVLCLAVRFTRDEVAALYRSQNEHLGYMFKLRDDINKLGPRKVNT